MPSGGQQAAHTSEVEEVEYLYKILVVGDLGCGKTAIIQRYVNNQFSTKYRATIGVDFALKVINMDATTNVRLQLWDIAGQERFGHMTRVYYKEAVGAVVVYDITRQNTFDAVKKWKQDLDENLSVERPLPVILLANKCDLAESRPDVTKMDNFAKDQGFIAWYETSAKEDINITKAIRTLVQHILDNDPEVVSSNKEADGFKLTDDQMRDDKPKEKETCC
eukprot:Phypoly_transcript_14386.p1 GENE.Phypoly_transcript_14386~~Phypoly_transcript_14386.p1  ORF type:complete len:221 (+),score=35.40 Phypoly_transcript_14386:167-829(+)